MRKTGIIGTVLVLVVLAGSLYAQRGFRRNNFGPTPGTPPEGPAAEWTFARLAYDGLEGNGPLWDVDYPGAEYHFSRAVKRLTRIDPHEMPWNPGAGASPQIKPHACANTCCAAAF